MKYPLILFCLFLFAAGFRNPHDHFKQQFILHENTDTFPYNASYSSKWVFVENKNVETGMIMHKAWEHGDLKMMRNTFGDSINMLLANGELYIGKSDDLMLELKDARKDRSKVVFVFDKWLPVHSVDKNTDWVIFWYKEFDTDLKGKTDSLNLQENLMFNKAGKIIYSSTYRQRFPDH